MIVGDTFLGFIASAPHCWLICCGACESRRTPRCRQRAHASTVLLTSAIWTTGADRVYTYISSFLTANYASVSRARRHDERVGWCGCGDWYRARGASLMIA